MNTMHLTRIAGFSGAMALSALAMASGSAASSPSPHTPAASSCVHRLADGDTVHTVGDHDVVTHRDGTSTTVKRCTNPASIDQAGVPNLKAARPKVKAAAQPVDGWQESSWMWTTKPVNYFHSTYKVPASPTTDHWQTDYYFTSAQGGSDENIIQPVLQYGQSLAGGTRGRWSIASWSLTSTDNWYASPIRYVKPGDTIYGSAFTTKCTSAGACDWTIWTHDVTNGAQTTLKTSGDKRSYMELQPGVLEAYGLTGCSDLPHTAMTFSAVHFLSKGSEVYSPYTTIINNNACQMSVTNSKYATTLHVNGR